MGGFGPNRRKYALAIGGGVEPGNLRGGQLLSRPGEVDRREVGIELVASVEVDVLPDHRGGALEDLGGGQFAAVLQLCQRLGQDQGVVVAGPLSGFADSGLGPLAKVWSEDCGNPRGPTFQEQDSAGEGSHHRYAVRLPFSAQVEVVRATSRDGVVRKVRYRILMNTIHHAHPRDGSGRARCRRGRRVRIQQRDRPYGR